jgi:hypothetical protein
MYDRDVPVIRAHALASDAGMVDLIEFVLCTIQQPLQRVHIQREEIARDGVDHAKALFGAKRDGAHWARANAGYLRRVALDILTREDTEHRAVDLVQHFMQVPSLGMVKAAFVAQCLGEDVACLDTHNLTRLGLPEAAVKVSAKLKPETIRAKVLAYVRLTRETGGAAYWWNTWCEYVAGRRGSPLRTGDEVSAYHVGAVIMA